MEWLCALLGASLDFSSLESKHPEILEFPGFGLFLPISMYRLVFPLSTCPWTRFSMFHSKIPKFLESSRNYLELWIPVEMVYFCQAQHIGWLSHSIFGPELYYQCGIPKFHYSWNLPRIIWNSWISLEMAYYSLY